MPNPVLVRLREDRARQFQFIDDTLARVDADGRDLVDAELANLTAARETVARLDAQIDPLEQFEALREDHESAVAPFRQAPAQDRAAALARAGAAQYESPGAFIVDYMAARGLMSDRHGQRQPADPQAQSRVQYALQNQTTADTPGLLPHLIVGTVINLIDASRPFITSIGGGRPMGGIPGKTFGRPTITQHTLVGPQSAEKAELPTQKMVIGEIPFTKGTYGGAVDVSRQDIDWTSPAAWDILVRDLADQYAIVTEAAAATAFQAGAGGVNAGVPVIPPLYLTKTAEALYAAAAQVYASAKRLPDRIWMSTDLWGVVGPLLDNQSATQSAGDSSLSSFAGNLYGVSRIVVPSFPAQTLIVGWSGAYEVYEEVIGLLTAVEPSLLGVEVAYGGYIAHNYVAPGAVSEITGAAAQARSRSEKAS
jgi:HK97 family phage major capsid protein